MSTMAYRYTKEIPWHGMKDDDKVSLIATIEGLRAGAAISHMSADGTDIGMDILAICADHDLAVSARPVMTSNDIIVARSPRAIRGLHEGSIALDEFLGYPRCCSDAYLKQIRYTKDTPPTLRNAALYWSNARDALEDGRYPLALLYALHVPCAIDCAPSKMTAVRIKDVVERVDPVLAHEYSRNRLRCILSQGGA